MKLIEMTQVSDELAEMVALFRVELYSNRTLRQGVKKRKDTFLPTSRCLLPL